MQQTLRNQISLVGTGLHSGRPARLTVRPAGPDHGIVFVRTDVADRPNRIRAGWKAVTDTVLNTRLSNSEGVSVSTVEHLMAAFVGCGIHNALVEIDGPEVPVFDGSSVRFADAFLKAGIAVSPEPLKVLMIRRPVRVTRGDAFAELRPGQGFTMDYSIEFDDQVIGNQTHSQNLANGAFLRDLADCRTFCRQSEVDSLRARGLALGGTVNNAVVVDGDRILTPGGFRRPDECVRHKMLDALGDLAMVGAPIVGHYSAHKAGHALTNSLLHALFSAPENYHFVTASAQVAEQLPGMHVALQDLAVVG